MADLFDMRIGGAGWHLTSHLIAIAALFVACFAITGYITFREDSVPGSALKDQVNLEDIDADTLDLTGNATVGGTLAVTGNVDVIGSLNSKREVFTTGATTAATTLTTADSGKLIILGSTVAQIQVINLPTIPTSAEVGTFYDFFVSIAGNSGAAGSYTINTGGNATSLTAAPTAGFDDFIGTVQVCEVGATAGVVAAGDVTSVTPADGDGTLLVASDTGTGNLADIEVNSYFRCTAIAPSTTTAGTNVWRIEGLFRATETTNYINEMFTAP